MSLLTSLCAIRVANVPEVCMLTKKLKKILTVIYESSQTHGGNIQKEEEEEAAEARNQCVHGQVGSWFV